MQYLIDWYEETCFKYISILTYCIQFSHITFTIAVINFWSHDLMGILSVV